MSNDRILSSSGPIDAARRPTGGEPDAPAIGDWLQIEADGSVVFLETNTLPGLTKASFIPQQLAAAGIPIGDFLDAQLDLAVRRRDHPR